MARIKQLMVRVSPFDLDLELYRKADALRTETGSTWRDFLSEGVRLVIARAAVEDAAKQGGTEEV